jgi:hypothetical protein
MERGWRLLPNKAWVSVTWVGVGLDAVLWPKVPGKAWVSVTCVEGV